MRDDPEAYERGRRQGATDLGEGRARLFWQTRGSWGELLTQLVAERFQVEVQHISDITTTSETSYRRGYNKAVIEHIDETFGQGSFHSVLEQVERYRVSQYQRYLESRENDPA